MYNSLSNLFIPMIDFLLVSFENLFISLIFCIKFILHLFWIKYIVSFLTSYVTSFNCLVCIIPIMHFNHKSLLILNFILDLYFIFYMIFILILIYFLPKNQTVGKLIIKKLSWFIIKTFKEIEKELLNIDDVYWLLLIFFVVFGWFFLLCLFPANIHDNSLSYIFFMIPFMCFLVIFIPLFILYDQGIFFLTYLRGTASTTIFILEVIYDYIAILIMFIRIIIQNLRFFLMFLVYMELQEHINNIPNIPYMPWPDPYLGEAGTYLFMLPRTIKWFIIYKLPYLIFITIYYIGHLYAVFISNTIAYSFVVFWLYLLFYTCFFSVKFESFFKKRFKSYNKKYNSNLN